MILTAIVTSYCNKAEVLNNRITTIEEQQHTRPFIFNLSPDYTDKYWSAGGVLSEHTNYVAKSIDVTMFAGKLLRLRLVMETHKQHMFLYCYVKKSDNSYITLKSIVKGYDSVSKNSRCCFAL